MFRMRSSNLDRDGRISVKARLGSSAISSSTDRARPRAWDAAGRTLDRDEMEEMRPDVKPWDIDPEYVPKGRNYYEVRTEEARFANHLIAL